MLTALFVLLMAAAGVSAEPDVGVFCKEHQNRGLKYYVDRERNQVYPYYYAGCRTENGTEPAYDELLNSKDDAFRYLYQDYETCPGYAASTGYCFSVAGNDQTYINFLKEVYPWVEGCAKGSSCQSSWIEIGMCCDDAVAARYRENRKAICGNGEEAVPKLFGRRCEHNFCPYDSRCVQGEFEAYCCAPDQGIVIQE